MQTYLWRTPGIVLLCGGLVLSISLGVRYAFGLFLAPMSLDLGWRRETFALAIALQNLVWGVTQPFAGRLADRYGAGWIVFGDAMLYVTGLCIMSHSLTELSLLTLPLSGALMGSRADKSRQALPLSKILNEAM